MKKLLAFVAASCAASLAVAGEFNWIGDDASSWQSPDSYEEKNVPTAGDTVVIPVSGQATVTDADVALVSGLKAVLLDNKSTIVFDLEEDATVNASVRQSGEVTSYTTGTSLHKRGKGALTLAATGEDKGGIYVYRTTFVLEEGNLYLPTEAVQNYSVVDLTMSAGTVFSIPGNGQNVNLGTLHGDGIVTNRSDVQSTLYMQRTGHTSEFAGKVTGNIIFQMTAIGTGGVNPSTITLTGTESDFAEARGYGDAATVRLMKFGNEGEPSSIGTNGLIRSLSGGVRYVYLGTTGETCDKGLTFSNSSKPVTFDGGSYGGLTFTGAWGLNSSSPAMRRLALDGSNLVNECVFAGSYTEKERGGTNYVTYITKQGPGIWRLADNASRNNRGAIAVKDGTLRFDSVAEAGKVCSLGRSTDLYEDYFAGVGGRLDERAVPYAILLGGETTEGTFEYTGATDALCLTRPIGVAGAGRLRNATDHALHWKGVFGFGDGANTLTLDGASTDNTLEDVTNAVGTLSIAKAGTGTWTLTGDQTYDGTVSVDEGTLVVRRPATHPTWFKFTIQEDYQAWLVEHEGIRKSQTYAHTVQLSELAFYDAMGMRQGIGLKYAGYGEDFSQLQPGEVFQTPNAASAEDRNVSYMFDDNNSGNGWFSYGPKNGYMSPSTPDLWYSVIIRLPDDAPEIVSYDYINLQGTDTTGTVAERQLRSYTIEGSLDGVVWTTLTNVVGAGRQLAKTWNSNGEAFSAKAVRKLADGKGYPLNTHFRDTASVFEKVTSVSVAAGATLKLDAQDGGAATIRGLTIDPAKGAGTIDGFAFAETGTFNLTSLPPGGSKYRFTLRNCTGFENVADWSVRLNGQETGKYAIGVSEDGTVTIVRKGALVIIR